jgi:hypothetical protein
VYIQNIYLHLLLYKSELHIINKYLFFNIKVKKRSVKNINLNCRFYHKYLNLSETFIYYVYQNTRISPYNKYIYTGVSLSNIPNIPKYTHLYTKYYYISYLTEIFIYHILDNKRVIQYT